MSLALFPDIELVVEHSTHQTTLNRIANVM